MSSQGEARSGISATSKENLRRSKTALLFPGQALTPQEIIANYQFLQQKAPELTQHYLGIAQNAVFTIHGINAFSIVSTLKDPDSVNYQSTRVVQPIIFILSCLSAEVAGFYNHADPKSETLIRGITVAADGHSLGKLAAAVVAGVMPLEQGAYIAALRGLLMGQESIKHPSALLSTIGLTPEQLKEFKEEVMSAAGAELALRNSSYLLAWGVGEEQKPKFIEIAKRYKLRINDLGVPAFHTSYMSGAVSAFRKHLESMDLRDPDPEIVLTTNVNGAVMRTGDEVRENLIQAIDGPIDWSASLDTISRLAYNFVCLGPHDTLTKLNKANGIGPDVTLNTQTLLAMMC